MPAYAILGSTGNVGQALLKVLLQSPDNSIHAYCRSKEKLMRLSPEIADNNHVKVFEGSLDDTALVSDCLKGTRGAFLAIAETENVPGCSAARDSAHAAISALEKLKDEKVPLPVLVVLSSASLDHGLMSDKPKFLLNILYRAFSNIYDDLREAETFIRSKASFVSAIFIRPGTLSYEEQKGHALSMDTVKLPLSFLDLAAGMVECLDDSERYDMKGVAVNPTANNVAFPWSAPMLMVRGLLFHFFPWTHKLLMR